MLISNRAQAGRRNEAKERSRIHAKRARELQKANFNVRAKESFEIAAKIAYPTALYPAHQRSWRRSAAQCLIPHATIEDLIMRKMEISAYEIALRFVGTKEVPGTTANPQVLAMLKLDDPWPDDDAVPWCSAFTNYVAWLLRLPRSKSLAARSWLTVGEVIQLEDAEPGFDVVIFKRDSENQSGVDVIDAPGHVGFYAGVERQEILVLGGNQSDSVSIAPYLKSNLLGVRRLA